jgi:hypothetical protein
MIYLIDHIEPLVGNDPTSPAYKAGHHPLNVLRANLCSQQDSNLYYTSRLHFVRVRCLSSYTMGTFVGNEGFEPPNYLPIDIHLRARCGNRTPSPDWWSGTSTN